MSESQMGEEKDGKEGMDVFPVDETPTPTRILKLANDLFPDFQDPKENPFDMHFRKAAEAAQSGTNELTTSFDTSTSVEDESLNTPSIFPSSALNTPTPLRGFKTNSTFPPEKSNATPFKHKILKPLLPNPVGNLNKAIKDEGHALLRTTMGQTIKVFHMPSPVEGVSGTTTSTSTSSTNNQPTSSSNNKNEAESAERRERNRFSARRSRVRKQKHYEEIKKSQKALLIENTILRDEITGLKTILKDHLNCDITIQNQMQTALRDILGIPIISLYSPMEKSRVVSSSHTIMESDDNCESEMSSSVIYNTPGGTVETVEVHYQEHQPSSNNHLKEKLSLQANQEQIVNEEQQFKSSHSEVSLEKRNDVRRIGEIEIRTVSAGSDELDSSQEMTSPTAGNSGVHTIVTHSLQHENICLQKPMTSAITHPEPYTLISQQSPSLQLSTTSNPPLSITYRPTATLPLSTVVTHTLATTPKPSPRKISGIHPKISIKPQLKTVDTTSCIIASTQPLTTSPHPSATSLPVTPTTHHHFTTKLPVQKLLLPNQHPSIFALRAPRSFDASNTPEVLSAKRFKLIPRESMSSPSTSSSRSAPIINHMTKHQPFLLPRPSPPQTVAQDLTTKKLPTPPQPDHGSQPKNLLVSPKRKSEEINAGRPKKRGTLVQKLIDIKNKMSEDKDIDDFLQQIHSKR